MSEIIDKIKINNNIEASILGAKYNETNGGIAFQNAEANGVQAFAIGQGAANGDNAFAEGLDTKAIGNNSHAEGNITIAEGNNSHAEGCGGSSIGESSHSEGYHTYANSVASHAEGSETQATGDAAHSEGEYTMASGYASHAEGGGSEDSFLTAFGDYSHAEGYKTTASGVGSHAEGNQTNANGDSSHAEGENTYAIGEGAHSEGDLTEAFGSYSHAEGDETKAYGIAGHAEGGGTTAYGDNAHAEGTNTKAGGEASHTEGCNTKTATEFEYLITDYQISDSTNKKITITLTDTSGIQMTHALAFDTDNDDLNEVQVIILEINSTQNKITLGPYDDEIDWPTMENINLNNLRRRFIYILSHPELGTVPRNGASYAHAEGNSTQALGEASHAEGKDTKAIGNYSHAEGSGTTASGIASHASGTGTIASGDSQTVIGKYNQEDPDAVFIIGNGDSEIDEETGETIITRNNLFTIKTDGTVYAGAKNLTNPTVDNTIQNFKISDNFINGTTVTRNEKTTFIYNYGENATGDTLFQYLNPPITHVNSYTSTNLTKYPTIERWFGQPVYTCIINAGSTSEDSDGFRVIKCLPSDCMVIRYTCFAVDPEGDWQYIPQKFKGDTATNEWWAYLYHKENEIRMHQRSDATNSKFTIFLQVWYVDKVPQDLVSPQG